MEKRTKIMRKNMKVSPPPLQRYHQIWVEVFGAKSKGSNVRNIFILSRISAGSKAAGGTLQFRLGEQGCHPPLIKPLNQTRISIHDGGCK